MKFTGTVALLLSCILMLQAQVKSNRQYKLPSGVSENDVISGQVLVKVKPQYKSVFEGNMTNGRSALRTTSVKRLSSRKANNPAGRALAYKPVIDITQYFELRFDATQSVEEFINKLYESGYVEYAEPVYKEKMMYTPNDAMVGQQYALGLIKAYQAWDVTKGSEDIIIAIIDSGGDLDHPDIANQLYTNDDPVNGIDDDGNGYIDDIHGWDFSGNDVNNIYDPNFVGDNDPSIFKYGAGFTHGTTVGSLASGASDNTVGMAGIGFRSKLMFTKHYADNQAANSLTYNSNLYFGIIYAAENGARIINCSFGNNSRSQIYQDIITYATFDQGALIVAAAGNSNNAVPVYPASYAHVLSVAATDADDKRGNFSSYGYSVDITAPGVNLVGAEFDNKFITNGSGTSFAAPIVSGAAALLAAYHPEYTPTQIAEQLRATADATMYDQNPAFPFQLGKGRLDIYNALTKATPSVRAFGEKLVNGNGLTAEPGQHAYLSLKFVNHLKPTSPALKITISSLSAQITVTKAQFAAGTIASGDTIDNRNSPFELDIANFVAENTATNILITYEDGDYVDFQVLSFVPNPSYRTIDDNLIRTSISSSGRIGYENTSASTGGEGFVFNKKSLLFEMGLMMGSSSATILNTVRGSVSNAYDKDFVGTSKITEIVPGERSYSEIFGELSNSITAADQKVLVSYRSLVWTVTPYDKFIILEYKIKNPQTTTLTNFHFGLFADWDISLNGTEDAAGWDPDTRLGYVYPKVATNLSQAGIQLLTGSAHYFAIDNDQSIAGNPFGLYDGYTDTEKFTSLSTNRLQAGAANVKGNDVSHVVSAGPFTINSGEEITIAFALHAATSKDDLITSAKYADSLYNFTLKAPKPVVDSVETCYGAPTALTAAGASKFKWYSSFTGGEALNSGSTFILPELFNDTTLYVSNAEESYESVRTPAYVAVQAQPKITAEGPTTICDNTEVILTADNATEYRWSNGSTTRSITVKEAGDYSVVVSYVNQDLDCESTSEPVTVEEMPAPVAAFSFESGDTFTGLPIQFNDESTDAQTWQWDFGDGEISTDQHPEHTFDSQATFNVTLTVTNANGCQDVAENNVAVVTGIEDALHSLVTVHPNPSQADKITVSITGIAAKQVDLKLLDVRGHELHTALFKNVHEKFDTTFSTAHYSTGMYMLVLNVDGRTVTKKVLINR